MSRHAQLPICTRPKDLVDRQAFDALFDRYGPLLPSAALPRILGYPTASAFRQAVARGTVPVPVFKIPTRRGWFALASEVATWLAACRCSDEVRGLSEPATVKSGGLAESMSRAASPRTATPSA